MKKFMPRNRRTVSDIVKGLNPLQYPRNADGITDKIEIENSFQNCVLR